METREELDMARCSGCGENRCSCVIEQGQNITVTGAGTPKNPYVISGSGSGTGSGGFLPGFISPYAGASPPPGWLACDGRVWAQANYPDLYAVIQHRYDNGVDPGAGNFRLPDLAGRFPLGADGAYPLGTQGGFPDTQLSESMIPQHRHGMQHIHDMSHDHPQIHTTEAKPHHHAIKQSDVDGTNNNTFRRGGAAASRTVNTEDEGDHDHKVDLPPFPGNTQGSTLTVTDPYGKAPPDAFSNIPPYQSVLYIIKT